MGVSFAFLHRYGNLTILEFSSKWVKVILLYRGGRLSVVRGGGSLMTHRAGSVSTQSIFSNMRWLLNHTGTPDIYNRLWQVSHTLRLTFLKTKCF
jgi:hypothetical protein